MSFTDLLRQSRSKPIAALHKFLTNYDPNDRRRVYAFVEGDPDRAFYRSHVQTYVASVSDLYIYNCEGKAEVYSTFRKVVDRYPSCRRVLFFVDKDVDELVGKLWPSDPRIFVTDWYSIENYLVQKEVLRRYLADYVKIRRVEVTPELLTQEFDRQLKVFYRIVTPVMAWIIVMRRAGHRVVLADVDMGEVCKLSDSGTARRRRKGLLSYLQRVSQTPESRNVWRSIRRTSHELRQIEPKRYVRGKFEAWWFVEFVKRTTEKLVEVAKEEGGSVSVSVPLNKSNYIQVLAAAIPAPGALGAFLQFHLPSDVEKNQPVEVDTPLWGRLLNLLRIRRNQHRQPRKSSG
jgi:Protein of unknown function (DUF4435)